MDNKPGGLARGLYALIDDSLLASDAVAPAARAAIDGGAGVLQLRLKQTLDKVALALIFEVLTHARPRGAQLIVNDRVDLALLAGADGVHLGQQDLPVAEARRLLGPAALVGMTVRTLADIEAAALAGADHVGLGPIFATQTKALADAPIGVERFGALVKESRLPVVGISGVGLANISQVAQAGAHAAAVGSDLCRAADVTAQARALVDAFRVGWGRR